MAKSMVGDTSADSQINDLYSECDRSTHMDNKKWLPLARYLAKRLNLPKDKVYVRQDNSGKTSNIYTRLHEGAGKQPFVGLVFYTLDDDSADSRQKLSQAVLRYCERVIVEDGYDTVVIIAKHPTKSEIHPLTIVSAKESALAEIVMNLLPTAKLVEGELVSRFKQIPDYYPEIWVEMYAGENDHGGIGWQYGTCLWSPAKAKDGKDRYAVMREPDTGDLVIHLLNGEFTGISRVGHEYVELKKGPPNAGAWSFSDTFYRIDLVDYDPFLNPVPWQDLSLVIREDINEKSRPKYYPFLIDKNDQIRVVQGYYLCRGTQRLLKAICAKVGVSQKFSVELPGTVNRSISLEDLSAVTGVDSSQLSHWIKAIERKRQAILYGPPGTGKTYLAREIARYLIGGDTGIFELIQFHPSYSYDDFIEGIKPQSTKDSQQLLFPVVPGLLREFCRRADGLGRSVLIIDEINRANLSKVLGECLYLLEYRKEEIKLATGKPFFVPDNVVIIGTMNTADRSIALVDHAIRRRFAFLAVYPDYARLSKYLGETFDSKGLIMVLERINQEIRDRNFWIGTSYFMVEDLESKVEEIWRTEIETYLEEYFFDRIEKVDEFRWEEIAGDIIGKTESH